MKSKIQPLADYVVAQNEGPATKTSSGIFLPENSAQKSQIAVVLAAGKDVKRVKEGDRIIHKGYSSTEIKLSGEEYLLIKEEDIIATVNK
ncbi:MAG: co-chaperone GroES [Candidatus Saccharibacteria bacterium]